MKELQIGTNDQGQRLDQMCIRDSAMCMFVQDVCVLTKLNAPSNFLTNQMDAAKWQRPFFVVTKRTCGLHPAHILNFSFFAAEH